MFFFKRTACHRDLPSFPTRHSPDLELARRVRALARRARVHRARALQLRGRRLPRERAEDVPPRRAKQRLEPPLGQRVERSEEHTSELQSRQYLVCRLLLVKKKISEE